MKNLRNKDHAKISVSTVTHFAGGVSEVETEQGDKCKKAISKGWCKERSVSQFMDASNLIW